MLVINEVYAEPLKNSPNIIRYTLVHLNVIQRLNIWSFNWKSSLTLNTAKVVEKNLSGNSRFSIKMENKSAFESEAINHEVDLHICATFEVGLSA